MPDTNQGIWIMKRICFVFLAFVFVSTSKAQFPMMPLGTGSGLGWGTAAGSPEWCWQQQQLINAQNAYLMQMRLQELNYYRQQAQAIQNWMQTNPCTPYPGNVITRDGVILNTENINEYEIRSVSCEHCNGGFNSKQVYLGNGRYSTQRVRCNFCHGSGSVKRHVRKE